MSKIEAFALMVLIASILIASFPSSHSQLQKEKKQVMLLDDHHGWGYTYTDIDDLAKGKGWLVERIDVEPVTLKYLSEKGASAFVVSEQDIAFTDQEIRELRDFVTNGGNIIIEAPSSFHRSARANTRELTKQFGIDILEDGLVEPLTITIASGHPIFQGVSTISIISGGENKAFFLKTESTANVLLRGGEHRTVQTLDCSLRG